MPKKILSKGQFATKVLRGEMDDFFDTKLPESEGFDAQDGAEKPFDVYGAARKAERIGPSTDLYDKIMKFLVGEEALMGQTRPEKALTAFEKLTSPTRPDMMIGGIPMGPGKFASALGLGKRAAGVAEELPGLTPTRVREMASGVKNPPVPADPTDVRFREILEKLGGTAPETVTPPAVGLSGKPGGFLPARHPAAPLTGMISPKTETPSKPLGKGVQTQIAAKKIAPKEMISEISKLTKGGGTTYNLQKGNLAGTDAYAVSIFPERSFPIKGMPENPDKAIAQYYQKNKDLLRDPQNSIGTWFDEKKGELVLDIVRTPSSRAEAIRLGQQHGQDAIFDLKNMQEIRLR